MLSLEAGMSYEQLVGVDRLGVDCMSAVAMSPTQWKRVVPGDPAHSYLMVVIDPRTNPVPNGPTDPSGFDGPLDPKVGSMPENNPLLCAEKRDAIKRWIEQGAVEGTPDASL